MIANVAAISYLWRIIFHGLAGHQESGNTNELQLGSFDKGLFQVSVDNVNTKI